MAVDICADISAGGTADTILSTLVIANAADPAAGNNASARATAKAMMVRTNRMDL